jgi:hypothetical protein
MRAMESRNGRDKAKPEAISGRTTTPLKPVKAFEHV